jgi:hypothetical protein
MDKFKNHIDTLVSKVLNEEIESKIKQITETMSGEWTEIDMGKELKGGQNKLDVAKPKGKLTGADFKKLRDSKESKVSKKYGGKYGMEEQETEEGNAFSGALADAKKRGKSSFEVDGKKYSVKETKNSLKLTENELISMIEKIVMEQKVKDSDEKENISKKTPQGLKDTDKVLNQNKKLNDDHTKEVVKKMKEYLKDMSKAEYNENPEDFPRSNYDIDKDEKVMKYNPSEAVEEYIDAFSYPGMTNLVYDEIKPDDEKINKYLKGDSTTGNAVTDKNGKALGNVGKSKVGEKFKKNYDENLYGAEQMNGSYKRVSQPVDVAGEKTESGSLSSKKGSVAKANNILNKLESKEDKKSQVVSEEMNKMKNLIGYNRKTQ